MLNGTSQQMERGAEAEAVNSAGALETVKFDVALKRTVKLQLDAAPKEDRQHMCMPSFVAVASVISGAMGWGVAAVRTRTIAAAARDVEDREQGSGGGDAGTQSTTDQSVAAERGPNVTVEDAIWNPQAAQPALRVLPVPMLLLLLLLLMLLLMLLRLHPTTRDSATGRRTTKDIAGKLLKTTVTELESAKACMPAAVAGGKS